MVEVGVADIVLQVGRSGATGLTVSQCWYVSYFLTKKYRYMWSYMCGATSDQHIAFSGQRPHHIVYFSHLITELMLSTTQTHTHLHGMLHKTQPNSSSPLSGVILRTTRVNIFFLDGVSKYKASILEGRYNFTPRTNNKRTPKFI